MLHLKVELGQSKGLNIKVKSAKDLKGLDEKFDVIILSHFRRAFSGFFYINGVYHSACE